MVTKGAAEEFSDEILTKQQQLGNLCLELRKKEACLLIDKNQTVFLRSIVQEAFRQWLKLINSTNKVKMEADRSRWRLHAISNQDIDLQAWYHALFYQEVYRLRGHFWYKDAVLPSYRHSYDLVDNALTPLEEAALAHVLCSPDTSYGDVAGQMFIIQSILPPHQFALFQRLAAQGAYVTKYPRSGRPAKKLFRFSFVEGNIYLTWKGKFGNQGVGMGEVTAVIGGIHTEVLKWSATVQQTKSEQYLSILCADRSIDLYFESDEERDNWRELLKTLVAKEQGSLDGVDRLDCPTDFDKLILFSSIGKL